jgi:hypothetical protein
LLEGEKRTTALPARRISPSAWLIM